MPLKKKSFLQERGNDSALESIIETKNLVSGCPVTVGIAASTGDQDVLERLFTAMPPDRGLSFVVIMRTPSDGLSLLAEMLGRYTAMNVVMAEEGMMLRPGCIHLIPAGQVMTVSNGFLSLEEPDAAWIRHPIDCFFCSLAAEAGPRAIAVVLSGQGMDGVEGVKQIREADGIVIVKEPDSAICSHMPKNVIAGGAADIVLPAEKIPGKIAEIALRACGISSRICREITLDEELRAIFSIVKGSTGHDFSAYKSNTVMRRIERRMMINDVSGIEKYISLLRENVQEAQALCQDILIGVTSFFRDPEAFAILTERILPRLLAKRDPDEPLRIWHACCATGEEVYSMAMLVREYLHEHRINTKVLIFATDIDEVAIAQARAGLYSDEAVAGVGEKRLKTFFTRTPTHWLVTKTLREMVVFAHHSLIKDPPFSRLDLLVCRNFLIYLNPDMQKRLIALFHQVLKPQAFLFLGSSETVGHQSDLFASIDKKWKIFERLECKRRGEPLFPLTAPVRRPHGRGRSMRPASTGEPGPGTVAERLLMERYCPPCVVVNDKYEVVHVTMRGNQFLEVPAGEPTRNILQMAREELRPALRAAIHKAFADRKQVVFRSARINAGKEQATEVNVVVEPIDTQPSIGGMVMVIFEQVATPTALSTYHIGEDKLHGNEASREILIRQLEEQLHVTHEQLHATSEQLESYNEGFMSANEELMSINEEFQSANEELQSSNEELETSKEELQALNEELGMVNAELLDKLEELNQANSDMENLLASSGIATIFLDRQLTIKRFTPAMAGILNLIPADVGRPFRHLAGTIDCPELGRDAGEVLEKLVPIEREVTAVENGRGYIMRVLPYRTTDGGIDGIVITLIDITRHKLAEEALRQAKEEWERTFASVPDLITILDNRHRVLRVNDAMASRLGLKPEECVGLHCYEAIHGTSAPPSICPHYRTIENGGEHVEELHMDRFEGDFIITTTPLLDKNGDLMGSVHVARDITERKRMEDALKKLNEELEDRIAERTTELVDTIEYLQFEVAERENAEEKLLRLNRLHAVLSETNQAIIRTKDRNTLFNDFCRIAVENGGFKLAWVALLNEGSGDVERIAANGATGYLDDIGITLNEEPAGLGPTGLSVLEGTEYICNDFLGSPITRSWHEKGRAHGFLASASIALKQEEQVIGALTLYADKKDFFDQQQITLLRQMGADISFALDNIVRETRRWEAKQALREETAERLRAVEALRKKEQLLIQQSRQAAMGEMIGNIAHQWRQPLNALGLTIQGLLLFYDLDEFNREFLEKGVSNSMELIQHMSRTIDDFRNYFRPDKEKGVFKVAEAVKNTLSLIEASFKNQHISIEIVAMNDPAIHGYRNEFAQALLNILNNSRDALTEQVTEDPKVRITICNEGKKAVVIITDNAGGIPEEIMGKIFDPYFTTKGPQGGTGVGLFMSKAIIEKNMGGRLIAYNIANGAEFRIEV